MSTSSRIGAATAKWSIGISALFFLITPIFTPAIVAAAVVGTILGIAAFAFGARRIALVAIAVAVIPLCGLLMLQYLDDSVMSSYLVIAPLVAVVAAVALLLTGAASQDENPFHRH